MRFNQFFAEDDATSIPQLITVLNFIKNRASDQDIQPTINTISLINMVKNLGLESFNYDDLVFANKNNSTVQNLIKSMNKNEIILKSDLSDNEDSADDDNNMGFNPEDTVDNMAKRAAKKRSS